VYHYGEKNTEYIVFDLVSFDCVPQGNPSSILDQKIAAQTQDIAVQGADLLHGQHYHILQEDKFENIA